MDGNYHPLIQSTWNSSTLHRISPDLIVGSLADFQLPLSPRLQNLKRLQGATRSRYSRKVILVARILLATKLCLMWDRMDGWVRKEFTTPATDATPFRETAAATTTDDRWTIRGVQHSSMKHWEWSIITNSITSDAKFVILRPPPSCSLEPLSS